MLVTNISGIPLYLLIPLINLPSVILGYYQMGLQFAVKSTTCIIGLALCLAWVSFSDITQDKLGSLNTLIKSIDAEAFIIKDSINDVQRGIINRRLH